MKIKNNVSARKSTTRTSRSNTNIEKEPDAVISPVSTPLDHPAIAVEPPDAQLPNLHQLEDVITDAVDFQSEMKGVRQNAQAAKRRAAEAFAEICERGLYAETHDSIESYGKERWGYSPAHVYRVRDFGALRRAIAANSPMGELALPTTERQVRPLWDLPEKEHVPSRPVWVKIAKVWDTREGREG